MTSLVQSMKTHRENVRTRRAMERALSNAGTPGAREDLLIAWQRAEDARHA